MFRAATTLRRSLTKVKTIIPPEKKKGVVYEVPCQECEVTYIGETGRTLKKRLTEHKYAVKRGNPENGIAVHANTTLHAIDWESAKVLEEQQHWMKRRVAEAILIRDRD